ncbi:MAG: hypothetical protein PHZ16_02710, partial [Eubacteriales bacterium]|nr:hypothetical protein [Eubacteriales bacterium]
MAKSPSSIYTRLALTVAARYYPTEGIIDSYCLDGRFPGRREQRSVDSTLDREDRGFLFSVFGYPYTMQEESPAWREPLELLTEKINDPSSDIDRSLNDLAEAAMDITGRITLAEEGVREPYFSGFVLRDGELAAVTLGDGVALLYRRGILYPLTDDTMDFNAIDANGQPVSGINDFVAGEAGTLRYSNIAQIEQGDQILICNQELYQALGQRDIMRILNSAEDQYDASGLLLTSASAQVPGTPLQLMLGLVESVTEDSQKSSQQLNLGRFNTQAVMGTPFDAPTPAESDDQATQRYQRQDMVDFLSEPPAEEEPSQTWASEDDVNAAFKPAYPDAGDETASFDDLEVDDEAYVPGFAYTSPEDQRRRFGRSDDYDEEIIDQDDYSNAYQGQVWDDSYLEDEDEIYYDEGEERAKYDRSNRNKQIIFYVVLIAIIALSIFALIKLLSGGEDEEEPGTTLPSNTGQESEEPPVIVPPVDETEPATDPTIPEEPITDDPEPEPVDTTYVVQSGDSPWNIIMNAYGTYSEELY